MTTRKERLTVTVDPEVVLAANQAVAEGRADSLSSWVNMAMVDRAARERRVRALAEAVREYEAEFGEITEEEMVAQARADRQNATIVRRYGDRAGRRPGEDGFG